MFPILCLENKLEKCMTKFLTRYSNNQHDMGSKKYTMKLLYNTSNRTPLTLPMLNFLNGTTHLPFLALSIIIFRKIKMKIVPLLVRVYTADFVKCFDSPVFCSF